MVNNVSAHPVPKENHDRTITVKLKPAGVEVTYQLEVDESRAELDVARLELPAKEFARITSSAALHQAFLDNFGPILAGNLFARLDGAPLVFTGKGERDDMVKDHLCCNFTFKAAWTPSPRQPHTFDFREANYDQDDFSRIHLTLTAEPGVTLQQTTAPDKALLERPPLERKPGDSERLRNVSATFLITDPTKPASETKPAAKPPPTPPHLGGVEGGPPEEEDSHPRKLLHLLLDTKRGLVVLLLLAAGFGAVHALTPGHGKTLVAAYLVGEHGTAWHALLLGLMTTLTHTGAVFVLAVVFLISPGAANLIYFVQGLIGGLFIAGLGVWLLFR